jgi:hypothetical protein
MNHDTVCKATELADSALIDYEGKTFVVTIERDPDDWQFVRVCVDELSSGLELPNAAQVLPRRASCIMPSDGDLSGVACRLCAEVAAGLHQGDQGGMRGAHFRVRENAAAPDPTNPVEVD